LELHEAYPWIEKMIADGQIRIAISLRKAHSVALHYGGLRRLKFDVWETLMQMFFEPGAIWNFCCESFPRY